MHTEDGSAVVSVMVGGRMVVEAGRPVGIDLTKIARDAEAARARLERANRGNKALYSRLETIVNRFCPGLADQQPTHIPQPIFRRRNCLSNRGVFQWRASVEPDAVGYLWKRFKNAADIACRTLRLDDCS